LLLFWRFRFGSIDAASDDDGGSGAVIGRG
jgi:hypothetical protein